MIAFKDNPFQQAKKYECDEKYEKKYEKTNFEIVFVSLKANNHGQNLSSNRMFHNKWKNSKNPQKANPKPYRKCLCYGTNATLSHNL